MEKHRYQRGTKHGTPVRGISISSSLPWLAMGNFNEILHAQEHDGVGNRSQAQMNGFQDALDMCGLFDIGYKGTPRTFLKRKQMVELLPGFA